MAKKNSHHKNKKFFVLSVGLISLVWLIFAFVYFSPIPRKPVVNYSNEFWPMFRHDMNRSGNLRLRNFSLEDIIFVRGIDIHPFTPEPYDQGLSEVVCSPDIEYDENDTFHSSPIFVDLDLDGADEVITYFKVYRGNLYKDAIVAFKYDELRSALNRKFGAAPYTILWEHVLPCEVHTSFAASDLNNDNYPEIAFGCDDGNLYVLDKDGKLVFNFKTNDKVRSTPAIADIDFDGKPEIIFGSDDGNLYVLSNEGKLKWSFKTKDKIESSPAIFVENKTVLIAFGSDDGNLYLIGRYFQELEFYCSYKAMGKIRSSPIIYSKKADYSQLLPIFKKEYTKKVRDNVNEYLKNGRIVFGSDDGNVYILNFNCELIKEYKTGGRIRSSPAMLKDMMAIGSENGNLYFLNETYFTNISLGNAIYATPVVMGNKVGIFTSTGEFFIVTPESKILIRRKLPTKNFSCSFSLGYIPNAHLSTLFSCFTYFQEKNRKCVNVFIE